MVIKKSPSTEVISKLMPVIRFGWFFRNLQINNNSIMPICTSPDYYKLFRIKPYLDSLKVNIKKCFLPSAIVSVDESMIKFKGRSSIYPTSL